MPRRPSMLVLSIVVHAIVLVLLATSDLWTPVTTWPTPRVALAFVESATPVRLEDIELPRPSRAGRTQAQPTATPSSHALEAAPIAALPTIAPERQGSIGDLHGVPGPIYPGAAIPVVRTVTVNFTLSP